MCYWVYLCLLVHTAFVDGIGSVVFMLSIGFQCGSGCGLIESSGLTVVIVVGRLIQKTF